MDVIDSSHMEVIKNFVQAHPGYSWKMRKGKQDHSEDEWVSKIIRPDGGEVYRSTGATFGSAVARLSNLITMFN